MSLRELPAALEFFAARSCSHKLLVFKNIIRLQLRKELDTEQEGTRGPVD